RRHEQGLEEVGAAGPDPRPRHGAGQDDERGLEGRDRDNSRDLIGTVDDLFAAADEHHSLFFALLPAPPVVAGIRAAQQALEAALPPQSGAGVPDARLHLTLHWLGEWSQLPQVLVEDACIAAAHL